MVRALKIFSQPESPDTLVDEGIRTPTEYEDGGEELVGRPKVTGQSGNLRLDLHPLPDGVLVSVCPPEIPSGNIRHVPCDIVLVIDVSSSMNVDAPVPTENPSEKEENGLTVLDLTKHAALTILESLDENDRLGVVTFSTTANIIQSLIPMTADNKKEARNRVQQLSADGMTNLWHGILQGIEVSQDHQRLNSASAIMVLTDGQPNLSCPAQGYVAKLRTYQPNTPIHTFGFGYAIVSGLLKSIAEVSGGNFAFIPDAGLIGTVFVHAIAHLQSTFAKSASLQISSPMGLELTETIGEYVRKDTNKSEGQLTIPLGNLQYGQSRDILLSYRNSKPAGQLPPSIQVELQCQPLDQSKGTLSKSYSILDTTDFPQELISYHRSRSEICSFLSTIAPLSGNEQHTPIPSGKTFRAKQEELEILIAKFPASQAQDQLNKSLIEDLSGQIRLAFEDRYFFKWGRHFLQSIHNAHAKQLCNSFKDPGPLQYNKDSPLFTKCRDELDRLFDTLPPPLPTGRYKTSGGGNTSGHAQPTVSMSQYHNRGGVCFAAECQVRLINGTKVNVSTLRKGTEVWTAKGGRKVAAVVATRVNEIAMCRIGELAITPWHPFFANQQWAFPNQVAHSPVVYTGVMYSLLLEPNQDVEAHGVEVGGIWATTLGHGITRAGEEKDARAHAFFGDYEKVVESLKLLPVKDGVFECSGVKKDKETGVVCEFLGALE